MDDGEISLLRWKSEEQIDGWMITMDTKNLVEFDRSFEHVPSKVTEIPLPGW